MRLYYNPELLFRGIKEDRQKVYFERILDLAKTINNEEKLTQNIIDQFKIKKMKGTETIFKFYLNNQDGARCLFKYEERDNQVFQNEPGIILLRATSHDTQGEVGKLFDQKYITYEQFLLDEKDDTNLIGSDDAFDNFYGKQYLKTYIVQNDMDSADLITKMLSHDHKAIYKLSDNQALSLSSKGPVFLMGSAGSGKTLVEVCKAIKNAHRDVNQAYFTYTKVLKESAETVYNSYKTMKGIIGKTSFNIIRTFFIDTLHLTESNYFGLSQFIQWFKSLKFNAKYKFVYKLDPIDLWTEIRGLIKGYIGNDAYRILEFTNSSEFIQKQEIEELLNQKLIERINNSNSKFVITNSSKLGELKDKYIKLHKHLVSQDIHSALLDEYSYVKKMNKKYSRFNEEERANIYSFVKEVYQKQLDMNNQFDDNDLSRMLLEKVYSSEYDKRYDYLFIDEVQDLTEMQIFTLAKLVSNPENLFMSGDVSQIINPTFFHEGRLGSIFKHHFNGSIINTDVVLNENYRNSENIVNIIQELLKIRRRKIGKYSYDIEEEATELEKREGLPIYVKSEHEDFLDIIKMWIGIPNVAVIVSNEESKKKLLKDLDVKNAINIYTVQEIKGLEFDKIISYNIASDFKDEWSKIMMNEIDKGSDEALQYRIYFNILYVAVTRGRINLFVYEENPDLEVFKELKYLFEEISNNLDDIMNITEYDTEENHLRQANEYFKNGDYERAHRTFTKINNIAMMTISSGFQLINDLNHKNKAKGYMRLYGEKKYEEDVYRYIDSEKHPLYKILYGYRLNKLSLEEINLLVGDKEIVKDLLKDQFEEPVWNKKHKNIFKDTLNIMGKLYKYRVEKQIERIKGEN